VERGRGRGRAARGRGRGVPGDGRHPRRHRPAGHHRRGRRPAAIAVSDDGYDQLLLDPHSYQVIGLRQLSTGPRAAAPSPKELAKFPKAAQQQILKKMKSAPAWPPRGAVILSLAYAQVTEVSDPGIG